MSTKSAAQWLVGHNKFEQTKTESKGKKLFGKAKTISITSGKGGVGKTSVTLKLAKILSQQGFKTLVIDCDFNLSNTAVKLGLPITDNFYSLISARKPFEECIVEHDGFFLLSGCNGNMDLFDDQTGIERFIIDILVTHEKEFDYILLDSPAGIAKENLTLNAYSDHRFVVVTPDLSSITDSYSLIKILSTKYGVSENHLIVNKISTSNQLDRIIKTLGETVDNFLNSRLRILGGLVKKDISIDKFDKALLSEENSALHKNFLKVVELFAEENVATTLPISGHGHEVQQLNVC
ncbi:AAA family ATPase [Halobacteriovorax sp. HLS]|uniref:AAA family ATPase n=1 Tax=Halobacteriovorax sp. HLS TaxID=2234000 RepID=UPI000FDA9AB4|nr:AAA family ATPase [Halobacteriovorax sp. HLS]